MRRLLIIFLVFLSHRSFAQALSDLVHIQGTSEVSCITIDAYGNKYGALNTGSDRSSFITIGGKSYSANPTNIVKFRPDGQVDWLKPLPGMELFVIKVGPDGMIYAAGAYSYFALEVIKLDPAGNVLWMFAPGATGGGFHAEDILIDESSNVYVTGTVDSPTALGLELAAFPMDFLVKLNPAGQRIWARSSDPYKETKYIHRIGNALSFDANGNVVMGGWFHGSISIDGKSYSANGNLPAMFLTAFSPDGNRLWFDIDTEILGGTVSDISIDNDNSIYVTGEYIDASSHDVYVAKLNRDRKKIWLKRLGIISNGVGTNGRRSYIRRFNERLYLTAHGSYPSHVDGIAISPGALVGRFKIDTGELEWASAISDAKPVIIDQISPNRFVIGGSFRGKVSDGSKTISSTYFNGFTAHLTDTVLSGLPGVRVAGKVFVSEGSCDPEVSQGMANILVEARPGPFYGISRSDGTYALALPPASYTIRQIIPDRKHLMITPGCGGNEKSVAVNDLSDVKSDVNFGNAVQKFPFLTIDVGATSFQRCFTGSTTVSFCNEGLADATNARVQVEFPEHILPLSSSLPWTARDGQRLTFDIGTLPFGTCRTIQIADSVRCGDETLDGLTQCIEASINPPNDADPLWDKSQIEVMGECVYSNFARFRIMNTGAGAMSAPATYQIYRNDVLSHQDTYQLEPGDSLVLQVPAYGASIRLEALTTPHSPEDVVGRSVEGCGGGVIPFATGTVKMFGEPDDRGEVEMHCGEIVSSYDPNDKRVIPAGITDAHNIRGTEQLEYLIRFQNTGTAPAHNVEIRDVLDPNLDLSTFHPGATSHKCTVEITGAGKAEVTWRFTNIMLPDSGTDEASSHGFVKFKIAPRKNLSRGTVISNSASIVFDYNEPIRTNTVFNTIGLPTAEPSGALTIQDCAESRSFEAGDDLEALVCDVTSYAVEVSQTDAEVFYHRIKGNGVVDVDASEIWFRDLSLGENIFECGFVYCYEKDTRLIRIIRDVTPPTPRSIDTTLCSRDMPNAVLSLSGDTIHWFRKTDPTEPHFTGNNFNPVGPDEFFVTARSAHCVSEPGLVSIRIIETPPPPLAAPLYSACVGSEVLMAASGSNIRWYDKINELNALHNGDTLFESFSTEGDFDYYVSQEVGGCESEKIHVSVTAKSFDVEKQALTNVITPDDDNNRNESFYLSIDENGCLGPFKRITIYDRNGKILFRENNPDFQWDARGHAAGVFFYTAEFEHRKFNGTLSVIK